MKSVAAKPGLYKGAALMMASNLAFCAMACLVRSAAGVNPFTSTLFRFVVGMAVIGALAMSGKARLTFKNKPGLFARGVLGGTSICIGFVSIVKLGIVKTSVIIALYPVFAAIFAVPFLGERLRPKTIVAFIGAAFGAAMVLGGEGSMGELFAAFGPYEALAVGGAMLAGLSVVLIKQLQATESTASIYFAQCLVGFWMVVVPGSAAPFTAGYTGAAVLVLVGLFAAAGQLFMTEAYRYLPVAKGALFVMLGPVFNIAAGAFVFGEPFGPRAATGSLVVLASCAAAVGNNAALLRRMRAVPFLRRRKGPAMKRETA